MLSEELLEQIATVKENHKKVGLVQGSWDLFHLGHLRYILKAKELCDFLIIAMDSDAKIRKRKGESRPVIPEDERFEFIKLLNIANGIVVKPVDEPKWNLIKTVRPDVLIAIKENYSDEDIVKLGEFCGRVAVLPRQAETSTSDKIRKITIAADKFRRIAMAAEPNEKEDIKAGVLETVEKLKKTIGFDGANMPDPVPDLIEHAKESTDWVAPVTAGCFYNQKWHFATNQVDFSIPRYDLKNRTELFYATIEHAEIKLLKRLGEVEKLDVPVWVTLFPCDRCIKVLADKGVKEIRYLEDHPERNWSKRSHERAKKYGIKLVKVTPDGEIYE